MIELKFSDEEYLIFISTSKEIVGIKNINDNNSDIDGLLFIDNQKNILIKNTISFLKGKKFNNAFLWGEKGMGKSSLIKSAIDFVKKKEKEKVLLLEILSHDLKFLPEIIHKLSKIKKKFIIFIDDITLSSKSSEFSILKVLVQGSILSNNKNIVFYVTSNLRSLVKSSSNYYKNELEIKDKESSLASLAERFGLKLGFHKCNKEEYQEIIKFYFKKYNIKCSDQNIKQALAWSIKKGGFSGRVAQQFAINMVSKIYS